MPRYFDRFSVLKKGKNNAPVSNLCFVTKGLANKGKKKLLKSAQDMTEEKRLCKKTPKSKTVRVFPT